MLTPFPALVALKSVEIAQQFDGFDGDGFFVRDPNLSVIGVIARRIGPAAAPPARYDLVAIGNIT
jgi:hypothetical protein